MNRAVLLADFTKSEDHPRATIICKDLSAADPAEASESIRVSEAVFVVSTTDPASIEDACERATSLRREMRSLERDDACGLLLVPARGGLPEFEAEYRTGLPVCGVLRDPDNTAQLARWIAQD